MSTTPPNPLTALAKRVERMTGRDKALGHEILLACGWRKTYLGNFYGPLYQWSSPDGKGYPEDRLPCPTESLDAAMTLKPDGYSFALGDLNDANFPWACVTDPNGVDYTCLEDAATPTLAFLSAILRARAASESSHG